MSFKIVPTPPFEKELKNLAKKYPSLKKDVSIFFKSLVKNPQLGTPIGSNCFKVRLAITSKRKGKSGGARVITYVQVIDKEIFLIAIYDKSEIDSISLNAIRDRLKGLN